MAASWRRPQGVSTHGAWLVCALMSALSVHVRAVLPTGVISLQLHHAAKPQFSDLLASPSSSAGWGVPLPEIQNSRWKHVHMQALDDADPVGCTSYSLPSFAVPMHLTNDPYKTLVVVDRGNCSFLQKTQLATAAGARGLVVRGTKKAVYDAVRSQNHTNATSSGREKPAFEYDCNNGEAFVATKADPEWLTDDSRCSADAKCQSKSCVLTGHEDEHRGGFQVCCLWDTHILMGVGNRTEAKNVPIPVVYVTIADGKQLERSLVKYPELLMRTYDRSVPFLDVSSMLLWALGVVTAIGAAYYSASAEREHYRCRTDPEYLARRAQEHQQQLDDGQSQHRREQETLEIDGRTAVGFIVCAALFLTVFYYIKIAKLIPILFALSAVGSLTQVLMAPTLHACFPAVASRQIFVPVVNEALPLSEILGLMISAASSVVWFVHRRSAWYLQDLFGVVLCFLFLKTVQLPNLKVATILLSLAFCYDIFFVFISPLVFGSSVMEDVATGGAPAYTRDDYPGVDYCERYPTYEPCVDPEPMPMLLVLPRIMNWLGGVSMLGLGDIILPGLLLSYVLRFDYSPQSLGENYFRSVSIGYAVGLAMANLAVTITQVGQPALMYLVPTCLGTLLVLAKWNGDLKAMWLGVAMKDEDFEKSFDTDAVVPSAVHLEIAGTTQSPHDHAPLLGSGGLVTPR